MSTYCPKTLKGWKIQKRSLSDFDQSYQKEKINFSQSYIIHAFQSNKKYCVFPPQLKKSQRYKLEDSRSKSMRLSNGFRKFRKEECSTSFSKVISDDKLIKINNLIQNYEQKDRIQQKANVHLLKAKQRSKKLRCMRGQIKKKPIQNSILSKLLLIKTPSNQDNRDILFTDNQHPQLSQLERDDFSPYRSKRQLEESKSQNIIIPMIVSKKQQLPINQPLRQQLHFLSISQINLNKKQKQPRPKLKVKKRSFSHKILQEQICFAKKKSNGIIQPWQFSQVHKFN